MTAEVQYVSFTLTDHEIKNLNKYRKLWKEDAFHFELRLTPNQHGGEAAKVEVRAKDCSTAWVNLTNYIGY